jgi:tRNA modification GTPase
MIFFQRNENMESSTVAAIATACATAGVGIVRISGSNALAIAKKMFDKSLKQSHKMVYGTIHHNNNIIDKALACYFKAPNSYTGEDIVEFHCHGGIVINKMVLEAALANGASAAPAGEFTRRAFLNGRLDLAQAEAVGDLISAKTEDAVYVAVNQLEGKLSKQIFNIRSKIVDVTAHLTATLDFPEEIDEIPLHELSSRLSEAHNGIAHLLSTADDGRIIKDGINIAIIGAPNVGKSSLLNAIAGEDRAIVTDIAGTTRDVLEVNVNIRGCRVNLLDTAGIRQSHDLVERLGVERSVEMINKADIILLVLDGSRELNEHDKQIIELVQGKNVVCLINKCDLTVKIAPSEFKNTIKISAVTGYGLDELFSFIAERYSKASAASNVLITNQRHKQALIHAHSFMSNAIDSITKNQPADIVLGDLELCIAALGEIDGMTVSDEIIDNIFSNFCVGK